MSAVIWRNFSKHRVLTNISYNLETRMPTVTLNILKSRLNWADFRRVGANAIAGGDAEAGGNIRIRASGRGATEVVTITVTHTARVESDTVQTSELLRHEQGHLDLVIIAAHQVKQDIEGGASWASAARTRMRSNATEQVTYDSETSHGTDAVAQQRWNVTLERLLASFLPPAVNSPCLLPRGPDSLRDPMSFGIAAGML
jgi:hypothetical protein